ncbi:MAG TPA: Rieske 2Fe-2S domain-containing protein [Chloroflexota bacterium]|nr:Rieske 2Fe-2S domain-containing protein [Chloroflexota bacterium]
MSDEDRFDRALERLLADHSPRAEAAELSGEERDMLRMAQLIRGTRDQRPREEFVEGLHRRLFPRSRRVSRRAAFLSGIGALAAGLAGGLGLDQALRPAQSASSPPPTGWTAEIVDPQRGKWFHVANVADVPEGAIMPFTAGAVSGFLMNTKGTIVARSRMCTHLGCALDFHHTGQKLVCPCHGAEFNLQGDMLPNYPTQLASLPEVWHRVNGERIEVFGA